MGVTGRNLMAAFVPRPASAIIAGADQRVFDPVSHFAYAREIPAFAPGTRVKQGATP